jgi:alkylation response protein AidB-like acyl-CoA dehydrogenase
VVEQMGRTMMATPFVSTTLAAQAILSGGTEEQQAEWLPRLASGAIGALALAEAHGDWNLSNITATATRDGAQLRLAGKKQFVLWADSADVAVVSVQLDGKPALALLGKAELAKASLRRETIVDETKRSFELGLDGLTIAETALLDPARATAALDHIDRAAMLLQSAEMCGGTQAVIDYTLDYLRTRKQFGKQIGEYQAPMPLAIRGRAKLRCAWQRRAPTRRTAMPPIVRCSSTADSVSPANATRGFTAARQFSTLRNMAMPRGTVQNWRICCWLEQKSAQRLDLRLLRG